MASISIASGKFSVYRNDLSDGSSPFVNILSADDGAGCVIQDSTGKVWVFRIYDAILEYKLSTDTIGSTFPAFWTVIWGEGIKDGIPTAECLPTGRIMVSYWKTDNKWYQSYTENYGTDWTEVEITTA